MDVRSYIDHRLTNSERIGKVAEKSMIYVLITKNIAKLIVTK